MSLGRWIAMGNGESDFMSLTAQAQVTAEEMYHALVYEVTRWTEVTLEWGADPRLEGFVMEFPEWGHQHLYDVIEAEINRVKGLVECERAISEN